MIFLFVGIVDDYSLKCGLDHHIGSRQYDNYYQVMVIVVLGEYYGELWCMESPDVLALSEQETYIKGPRHLFIRYSPKPDSPIQYRIEMT